MAAFSARFRVIAYSRRFAPPNAPAGPADISPLSGHVADLEALVRALRAVPAHFVAHSYGAYITLALAVDKPDLVRSLVLGEPPILNLLSRTAVGDAMRQSWMKRVLGPARAGFEKGGLEEGLRQLWDGVCGRTGCFDSLPQARRTQMVNEHGREHRAELMTGESYVMVPDTGHGMHLNVAFYDQAVGDFLQCRQRV